MTMSDIEVHSIYPTPIYVADGFMLSEEKQNRLIEETSADSQQNFHGNFTSNNRFILERDYLSELREHLHLHINKYAHEVFKITSTVKFYITQSWLNINNKGEGHHLHNHANSFFSGTYYIKGETPLFFKKNVDSFQNFDFDINGYNQFNSTNCSFPIQPGKCILFPSALQHFVNPNETDTQRVSLSFNCFFKGEPKTKEDFATYLKI